MGKTALRLQKLLNGRATFFATIIGVNDLPFDDLEERIEPGLNSKLADLVRIARMEIPPLRTRIVSVDERRTSHRKRLLHLIHVVHRRGSCASRRRGFIFWVGGGPHYIDGILSSPVP